MQRSYKVTKLQNNIKELRALGDGLSVIAPASRASPSPRIWKWKMMLSMIAPKILSSLDIENKTISQTKDFLDTWVNGCRYGWPFPLPAYRL